MPTTETLLAECCCSCPYGPLTMQVWEMRSTYSWLAICAKAQWLGEWAWDDEAEEIWEEIHPWGWENPEEFPTDEAGYMAYLSWCASVMADEFEARIARAVEQLSPLADRYYKRHRQSPTAEWLVENFPDKGYPWKATPHFKARIADIVGQEYRTLNQLSLF